MSYAVIRMQKMKSNDLKGIQFHNQRERKSKTNSDIDESKSHLNYDLVNEGNIDYNERVKEIIDSQKTSTRKIRKDAVLVNELLVTSDSKFFEALSPGEQRKFFEDSLELFKERYGEQNIAYATVHVDEKTPHMHVGVVPMRDGKLQGKNVFNREELLWLQEEFPKRLQSQGFNLKRGERGSEREHIETAKFKRMTIEKEVNQLLEKRDKLLEAVPEELIKVPILKKETEKVKVGLLKTEERETGNVVLSEKQYKRLNKQINAAVTLKKDYERLKNTDLYQENQNLVRDYNELAEKYNNLIDDRNRLLSENRGLKTEIQNLKQEIQEIYKITKDYLKERTNDFRGVLERFIDKVKENLPKGRRSALEEEYERLEGKRNKFSLRSVRERERELKKSDLVRQKSAKSRNNLER